MERRNPAFRELLMVLMAPAPGVKLMRAPAPARASHRENCTNQSYAGGRLARHHNVATGSKACWAFGFRDDHDLAAFHEVQQFGKPAQPMRGR